MKFEAETVNRAFEAFYQRYVTDAKRQWDLDNHSLLWAEARSSVESSGDDSGFLSTLKKLRSYWQISRGKNAEMLPAEKILPLLRAKTGAYGSKVLSTITDNDAPRLFTLVKDVASIKQVNGVPSLMAISKVLHFYNPRMFVIVDRAMVWDWALSHPWLWRPFESVRKEIDRKLGCNTDKRDDSACDPASYVSILITAARMLGENPHVAKQFASFLRRHTTPEARLPDDLEYYEAAAVEWLLLGLVELPPAGVEL